MEDYQLEIVEKEKRMSNRKLLNRVMELRKLDFNSEYTTREEWEYGYLSGMLINRLGEWLFQ